MKEATLQNALQHVQDVCYMLYEDPQKLERADPVYANSSPGKSATLAFSPSSEEMYPRFIVVEFMGKETLPS